MKLSRYLKTNGLSAKQFAVLVEASEFAVNKWCRGERIPRGHFMKKIVVVTNGDVSANDFLSPAEPARARSVPQVAV